MKCSHSVGSACKTHGVVSRTQREVSACKTLAANERRNLASLARCCMHKLRVVVVHSALTRDRVEADNVLVHDQEVGSGLLREREEVDSAQVRAVAASAHSTAVHLAAVGLRIRVALAEEDTGL